MKKWRYLICGLLMAGAASAAVKTPGTPSAAQIIAQFTGTCDSSHALFGDGTCQTASGGGGGTVTSVGLSSSGSITITGNPITTSGTFTADLAALTGDCTTSVSAITCTKTSGVAFGTFATASAATPPAIGGTTPAAATFTTVNVNPGALGAASWTTNGLVLSGTASTLTDTTASGTVTTEAAAAIPVYTVAATNAATTITNLATLYLPVPVAGTNVTATNLFSLFTAGAAKFTGQLTGLTGANISGAITLNTNSSTSTTSLGAGSTTGAVHIADGTGNASVTIGNGTGNVIVNSHSRIGVTATPTIASGACGATTNGTLSAAATDHAGEVIIGAAATTTCTVTFSAAFTTAPRAVLLTAGNAAAIGATVLPYVSSISTTNFVITGSILASTSFYYWVQ